MNATAKLVRYDVIFHGIDHSQYFPGCGTAFSDYDHCVTGIGDTAKEALSDCLEQMAMGAEGIAPDTIDAIEREIIAEYSAPANGHLEGSSVSAKYPDADELYWYVSIRYSLS